MGSRIASAFTTRGAGQPRRGDYLTDGRDLYRVEDVLDGHALLEDCRSLVMVEVDRRTLAELDHVRAGEDDAATHPVARPPGSGEGEAGASDDSGDDA